MQKLICHLTVLLLALNLTGCAGLVPPPIEPGQVVALHPGGTLFYLREAIDKYPHFGKVIMQQGENFLVMWTMPTKEWFEPARWGWTFINTAREIADPTEFCGQISCPQDARAIAQMAFERGFRPVAQVPPALVVFVQALEKAIRVPVIFIVPEGGILPEGILPPPGVQE